MMAENCFHSSLPPSNATTTTTPHNKLGKGSMKLERHLPTTCINYVFNTWNETNWNFALFKRSQSITSTTKIHHSSMFLTLIFK